MPQIEFNKPMLLKQETLIIVIARYDDKTMSGLQSQQATVLKQGYFVAMAYGTLSGCPIEIKRSYFKESCSDARYDLLGRSLDKQRFPDLKVPQYNFNHDYSLLTIE